MKKVYIEFKIRIQLHLAFKLYKYNILLKDMYSTTLIDFLLFVIVVYC